MESTMVSSRVLASWVAGFRLEDCSQQDLKDVKLRILDLLISSAAGWRCNMEYNRMVNAVTFPMGGRPESTVLFNGKKLPAPMAAYINATYGHGADIDDGHRVANGHPGVSLIPAVLALAEANNSASDAILAGILVGYETFLRVSMAVQPALLHRGFHGTGVVGAVAAAAACAKVLGLDECQTHNAISLASVQASGLFEVSESGQSVKPINPANACRTGVESALFARQGIQAPDNPFEGSKGFFKAFSGEASPEEITRGLGGPLGIGSCYIKLSPACRHAHPSIDAGIALGRRREIRSEEVDRIDLVTYPNAAFVTGKIANPVSESEAKFSMRYALAKALQKGRYSFEELREAGRQDPETEALIRKMELTTDPSLENRAANIRGGRVTVHFTDGTEESCFVPVPRGERENPLEPEDILRKTRSCCRNVLSIPVQDALYAAVMEEAFDLNRIMGLVGESS